MLAIYGASFNPPTRYHQRVVGALLSIDSEVIVVPCGPRPDKPTTNDTKPIHRAVMTDLAFEGFPRTTVDLFDLDEHQFTPHERLQARYADRGAVTHVVPMEFVLGGGRGEAVVQSRWQNGARLWNELHFTIVHPPGGAPAARDLPPKCRLLSVGELDLGEEVRRRVLQHERTDDLLPPEVAAYVERHALYRGVEPLRDTRFQVPEPRLLVVHDTANPKACEIREKHLRPLESDKPNLIVVVGGDGTMLHAIRQHWRRRLPFFGVNTGHLGFLLNETPSPAILSQVLHLYQLPLLRVDVTAVEGTKITGFAFNDAWVERSTGQTAWVQLVVNGQERIPCMVSDGVLVSTAAGSTSYARAMGASPVPMNTPVLLLVGASVLKPEWWRPVVLPLDGVVRLTGVDPSKRPLRCFIDGVAQGSVLDLTARVSNIAAVELAFTPEHDPAAKLARIQFPSFSK